MRRLPVLAALLAALFAIPASAAQWVTISRDKGRQIEIDRSSVLVSNGTSKLAWGRILLTEREARTLGYSSVNSLNRFDCRNRTFTAIRRVFFDDSGTPIREEELKDSKAARRTLEELVKAYPKTEAGSAARERLARMQ